MYFPNTNRSLSILFVVIVVIGGGLFAFSAPTAVTAEQPTVSRPVRLRLKVDQTTLRSNQATKMWAEFLDGDYNKAANDGTRAVKFEIEPRGSGSISPPTVEAKPGAWFTPYVEFKPGGPGRVLIRVSSAGLDSDQTFVLVTKPAASFLSQILALFEPVAYAQDASKKIEILPHKPFKNSIGSRVKFQISFSGTLPADSKIAISTDPSATIHYHGKDFDRVTEIEVKEIPSGKDGGMSDSISITSERVGDVEVSAVVSNGLRASETATFSPPSPSRILFDDSFGEVPSTHTTVPISIQLANEANHPILSDVTRSVTFRLANEDDPVEFEHKSVVFAPNQKSAGTMLRLKGAPRQNELTLYAVSQGENGMIKGYKTIIIKGPVQVMLYWLVFAALGGGLVGGVVRHIPKDYKLKQVLPKWTGEDLDLGLLGRIVSSVVCGLFLYLTMKLGVARLIGSPVLPGGIDLGTKLVAFFFGGIGGFAGTVVFDRLVSWCLPNPQTVKPLPVAQGVNNPAVP